MQVAIPLDKMSISDKLQAIEYIWDSLTYLDKDVPSPSWHMNILNKRERQIQNGEADFLELDEAKRKLRDRIT